MEHNYKRVFDSVNMSEEKEKQIRAVLASSLSDKNKIENEDIIMKNKFTVKDFFTRKRILISILAILLLLVLVGFTYNQEIIRLLSGNVQTKYKKMNGHATTFNVGFEREPVEVRNGQVYFMFAEEEINITEYCTEETYYKYEKVTQEGYRNIFIVGGNIDSLGYMEILIKDEGNKSTNGYNLKSQEWLKKAEKDLGIELIKEQ